MQMLESNELSFQRFSNCMSSGKIIDIKNGTNKIISLLLFLSDIVVHFEKTLLIDFGVFVIFCGKD